MDGFSFYPFVVLYWGWAAAAAAKMINFAAARTFWPLRFSFRLFVVPPLPLVIINFLSQHCFFFFANVIFDNPFERFQMAVSDFIQMALWFTSKLIYGRKKVVIRHENEIFQFYILLFKLENQKEKSPNIFRTATATISIAQIISHAIFWVY